MTIPDTNSTCNNRRDVSTVRATDAPGKTRSRQTEVAPTITIFAMPKPFGRDTDLIQRNAIKSWLKLEPKVDVLLIGDEAGIAETAEQLGARHAGGIEFNQQGTPLVSSAFEIARRETVSPYLCYCNSDVILLNDFVRAIELLAAEKAFEQFVAFGQRTDLQVDQEINFDHADSD